MNKKVLLGIIAGSILVSTSALAEETKKEKESLVSLSSTVNNEVMADEMTIITKYSVSGESSDEVKNKINDAINNAKEKLKTLPSEGVEYQFSNVNIHPVYSYNDKTGEGSKITGWRGTSTLKIISKDQQFSNASNAATKINDFVIEDVSFSLSKKEIKKYEDVMVKNAIEEFKQKAILVSENFNYSNYSIVDVSVSFNNEINYIQPRVYAPRSAMMMKTESNVEDKNVGFDFTPNKIDLSASVQGRIELIK